MTNSADPDQLASKPTDLELHCLLSQGMSYSAREGLMVTKVQNYSKSMPPKVKHETEGEGIHFSGRTLFHLNI